MRNRLRNEDGFLMAGAISLLAIFIALTATALTLSQRSLDQTNRDRRVVRALQAADAGADVAIFRLNHMLVASGTTATLGLAVDAAGSLGCTSVDVNGYYKIDPPPASAYCAAQSGVANDVRGAAYSYQVSTAVAMTIGVDNLLQRKIVVTGTANGVQRRVLVKIRMYIDGAGSLALYKRVRHTECTSQPTTAVVDSGCPGADLAA